MSSEVKWVKEPKMKSEKLTNLRMAQINDINLPKNGLEKSKNHNSWRNFISNKS